MPGRGKSRREDAAPILDQLGDLLHLTDHPSLLSMLVKESIYSQRGAQDVVTAHQAIDADEYNGDGTVMVAGRKYDKMVALAARLEGESDDDIKERGMQALRRLPLSITRDIIDQLDEKLAVYLATTKHRAAVSAALNGHLKLAASTRNPHDEDAP